MNLRRFTTTLVGSLVLATATHAGGTLYVDDDAAAGGDGSSWASAFDDLQSVLAAGGPAVIRIAGGRYVPGPSRGDSFVLADGVELWGGYAGVGAPDPDARDIDQFVTWLDGDIAGNDDDLEFNRENCYTVVTADETAVLDGVSIRGGNADLEPGHWRGGGVTSDHGCVTLRSCTIRENFAIIGGGLFNVGGQLTFIDCRVNDNEAEIGGGLEAREGATVTASSCQFNGNHAFAGAALLAIGDVPAYVDNCEFRANTASSGAGLYLDGDGFVVNCVFAENDVEFIGAGLYIVGGKSHVVANCVMSRNDASKGGGGYLFVSPTLVNCTFSQNDGGALMYDQGCTLINCISWGNTGGEIIEDPDLPGGFTTVMYSNVQGGWDGPGFANIDADPLFVQPGADDVRLGLGSPCVNTGDNDALPADVADVDGDGDTTETLPLDLAGGFRVLNGTVDMGAYEGSFPTAPPADYDGDIDEGDGAVLMPDGSLDPLTGAIAVILNTSDIDDATALATIDTAVEMPGDGYAQTGPVLEVTTSLPAGGFFLTVYVPFDESDLEGGDPFQVEPAYFDGAAGRWSSAVTGNQQTSPGHAGPVGVRVEVEGPGAWGITQNLGDFGVYWDPTAGQGFVWANVDHAAPFAPGVPTCPADVGPLGGDGVVAVPDLVTVVTMWTNDPTSALGDVNRDGVVDVVDLADLFAAWRLSVTRPGPRSPT